MSKPLLVKDPSEFLKNLKKPSKLSQKTTEGPQTATHSKPNRSVEGIQSSKKGTHQRSSHPYYFPSNSPTPQVSAHSTTQMPSRSQAKDKIKLGKTLVQAQTQIQDMTASGTILNILENTKKVSTTTSIIDMDVSEDRSPQMIPMFASSMSASANFSNLHRIDAEFARTKNNPNIQLTQTVDVLSARNSSNQGSISAQLPSTKSTALKNRKSVASDVRERSYNNLHAEPRSLSKHPLSSQKRVVSPSNFDTKIYKALNRSPTKLDDNNVIQEFVGREKKTSTTIKATKPPHPLKEIRIDIANFVDEPLENSNNRASTSRNRNNALLMNPRGELARNEKASRSRIDGVQTPQSATFSGLAKARFALGTPKRDSDSKDSGRSQLIKTQLTEDEIKQYGDRFPEGYEKVDFLGRGGFALVWLGLNKSTGQKVAVKQMLKANSSEAQKRELYFGQMLFTKGGEARDNFRRYPGIANIASFMEHKTSRQDDWMISELGGETLSKLLFDIRGEFFKSERIYRVKFASLYQAFKTDKSALPTFIKQMAQILQLFSDYNIVHSDLKPDNVLINMKNHTSGKPFDLKLIDFGSAYSWNDSGNLGMATPEYMPPELLNILFTNKGTKSPLEQLMETTKPWSVDIWSLGAIILEAITGVPLWMSLKCRVDIGNKSVVRMGLFAAKGRAYDKIYLKQLNVIERFDDTMDEYLKHLDNSKDLFDLLSLMMALDPLKRISPSDILRHPYLQNAI